MVVCLPSLYLKRVGPMHFYPVCLDISNKRCLVVGGGSVAERKATTLIECGAKVVLVAKDMTARLREMADTGTIDYVADDYREEYLEGAFLVIGATDCEEVNEIISRDAHTRGIPVNIVDDPARCSFIVPSVLRRGDLLVAVSTAGNSPALARRIREEIEERFGEEYGRLLTIMGILRGRILARGGASEDNRLLFEAVLDSDILLHIKEKNALMVRRIISDLTGEDIGVEL